MHKLPAYTVYLYYVSAFALLFGTVTTATSVYFVTVARLDPLQLVLVGTMLESSVFLFEVPTGIVADLYSRRLSVIIGVALVGLGFILEGVLPLFWTILAAQVIWGVGYTFTSGALNAWISDEIGEAAAGTAFLRGSQFDQAGAIAGTLIGIGLGSLNIALPIVAGGVLFVIMAASLVLVMPETAFTPLRNRQHSTFQNMAHTFKAGLAMVQRRPALRAILLIGLVFGLYSEAYDRLNVAHLIDNFLIPGGITLQPVVVIGGIGLVAKLLSMAVNGLARRRVDTGKPPRIAAAMLVTSALLVASLLAFALTRSLVVVVIAYILIYMTRTLNDPLYFTWVNHRLDSSVRATVLSMSSQVDAIGQIAGGPLLGAVGSVFGVRAALTVSALVLSPVLALIFRARRDEQ